MDRNTEAPTGIYANSGWQYQATQLYTNDIGQNYTAGTPWAISPHWALVPKHTTSGDVTAPILYNGETYNVVQTVVSSDSDLVLIRVDHAFSSYAPLYVGSDEVGQDMVVYGGGYNVKDQEIYSEGTDRFNGWTFKDGGSVFSWGLNQVDSIQDVNGNQTLYATFDAPTLDDGSANPNSMGLEEAMIGFGDSGGGAFIYQGGEWRLAGLIYAVDAGVYYDQTGSTPWTGAIFDARDLWADPPEGETDRVLLSGDEAIPLGFYSTDISAYRDWIDSVTGETSNFVGSAVVPESSTVVLMLLPGALLAYLAGVRLRRQ